MIHPKIEVMITEKKNELNRIEEGMIKTRVRIEFYKKLIASTFYF